MPHLTVEMIWSECLMQIRRIRNDHLENIRRLRNDRDFLLYKLAEDPSEKTQALLTETRAELAFAKKHLEHFEGRLPWPTLTLDRWTLAREMRKSYLTCEEKEEFMRQRHR